MEKLIDLINKYLPPYISIPLILHIIVLSGMMFLWCRETLAIPKILTLCGKIPILTIVSTAILLYLILLASYVFLCFKIRKNLKPRFGVLWDENKEPYCPTHEKLLTRHKVKLGGKIESGLDCIKCNKTIPIITDEGKRLSLSEAKKLL